MNTTIIATRSTIIAALAAICLAASLGATPAYAAERTTHNEGAIGMGYKTDGAVIFQVAYCKEAGSHGCPGQHRPPHGRHHKGPGAHKEKADKPGKCGEHGPGKARPRR